jgi:acetyltransferase-like isoleucine patch superfamily enzyme
MGILSSPVKIWRWSYEIGAYTFFAADLELRTYLPGERIVIGSYCSIGDQVLITTGGLHRVDVASTFPFRVIETYRSTANTTIGSDVWIGTRAMVRGGVTIGHGAVVGAGAVVFENVPPFAVVAGNPARLIRYRFSKAAIGRMLDIAWWAWPPLRVWTNVEWFYRPINEFLDHFDPPRASHDAREASPAGERRDDGE